MSPGLDGLPVLSDGGGPYRRRARAFGAARPFPAQEAGLHTRTGDPAGAVGRSGAAAGRPSRAGPHRDSPARDSPARWPLSTATAQYRRRLPPSGVAALASTSASTTTSTSGSHSAPGSGGRSQRTRPVPVSEGGSTR